MLLFSLVASAKPSPPQVQWSNDILFVVAAHVPNQRNCNLLRSTVMSVFRFHPDDAFILVVDNDSPRGNVETSLSQLSQKHRGMVIVRRKVPTSLQVGSWGVAHQELHQGGAPQRLARVGRVVTLQHSTLLTRSLPPLSPRKSGCPALSLAPIINRKSFWQSFERRRRGGMYLASGIAEGLGIRCYEPCLDTRTGQPVHKAPAVSWGVVPHAAVDFSRAGWEELCARMWSRDGEAALPQLRAMTHALDSGAVTHKELNGAVERLAGVLVAWLDRWAGGNKGAACAHIQLANVSTTPPLVRKLHGHTMGYSLYANANESSAKAEACHWKVAASLHE